MNLKGHWLKEAGFETGFTFTVKILNGCLVLIPDSEDTRAIKQQNQQQQAQLSEIKNSMRELMAGYISDS
ncbi:SymE family type I addiction module toxin [Proteus mirabilis]|uniref:SymE family type I addiction module toxin n=2 Tax=Enterobacterales TaxID=91347 RepID=UPI0034D6FCAF